MQPVPDDGAYEAEDVSDHGRNHDEQNRRHRVEWFDELHRLDHVRPKNEIENRLGAADKNKKRPNHMPAADHSGDHQPNFIGSGHYSLFVISRFYVGVCQKKPARGTRWVIGQKRV